MSPSNSHGLRATPRSQPSTPQMMAACIALDRAIVALADAKRLLAASPYEADVEAVNLFSLVVRHVEGVLTMARTDFGLVPPASVCARAAFETAIRAAWLVDADDSFVREARWLAHLNEAESANRRAGNRSPSVKVGARFSEEAQSLQAFREAVSTVMPKHVALLKSMPKLPEMIASIGGEHLYTLYIYFSQYAHGGHMAADLYRRHLGTEKAFGNFVSSDHWYIALRLCWLSLSHPANVVLSRVQREPMRYLSAEQENEIVGAIEAVAIELDEVFH